MGTREEFARWLRHARHALESAKRDQTAGDHPWACFKAEQAGQLALKALLRGLGYPAFGHATGRLVEALRRAGLVVPPEIEEAARALERHYIPPRYPDVFPEGTPADFYTPEDSERALQHAERILAFVTEVGKRELGAGA